MRFKENASLRSLYAVAVISLLLTSCNMINPDEEVPAYLYIPTITLSTNANQGANSHQIEDGWVYVNDNLIGIYELPATIPVLKTGACKVEIRAGIRKSGQGDQRVYYPFYSTYLKHTTLIPKVVDSLGPIILGYRSNIKFQFIEAFDEPSTKFELYRRGTDDTFIRVTPPEPAWGGSGGACLLHARSNYSKLEITTLNEYPLNGYGSEIYLEMDYRNNHQFTVGVYANQSGQGQNIIQIPILSLYPTTDTSWHKVYIKLTDDVSSQPVASKFKIFIGTVRSFAAYEPKIYIDNIKLLHFE